LAAFAPTRGSSSRPGSTNGNTEKGIEVPDAAMQNLFITHADFHGEWNYTLHSRRNAEL
jgi:hypothetical protein